MWLQGTTISKTLWAHIYNVPVRFWINVPFLIYPEDYARIARFMISVS